MKLSFLVIVLGLLAIHSIRHASAQQSPPRGQRLQFSSPPPNLPLLHHPLMAALDSNRDGILSTEEINNAAVSLKTLDRNHDGTIDNSELQPTGIPLRSRPEPETKTGDKPQLSGFTKLIMESDKNHDGKVTKDELPENMRPIFETADSNHDGVISVEEAERLGNPAKRAPRTTR